MTMKCISLVVLAVMLAGSTQATIRYVDAVPGQNHYTTIASAYSAAVNGDTLLLSAATFNESLTLDKRLCILGVGMDLCVINGSITLNAAASRTVLEGFRIINTNVRVVRLAAAADSVVIRRCMIRSEGGGCSDGWCFYRDAATGGGRLILEDCAFENVATTGCDGQPIGFLNGDDLAVRNCVFAGVGAAGSDVMALKGTATSVVLQNCVFVALNTLLGLTGAFPLLIMNGIAYDWVSTPNWGTYPAASTWNYNASSVYPPPGSNAILLTSTPFLYYNLVDNYVYGTSNLHLGNGCPCIDAGSPAILDLDGSRSDLGIYGGQTPFIDSGAPNYPYVQSLTVPPAITVGDTLRIQSQGRIGRGY
jgi:hypothetical protein